MLGGLWEATIAEWAKRRASRDRRSSSWSARTRRSPRWSTSGWPRTRPRPAFRPSKVDAFRNRDGLINTIRVDSKVVHETDTGEAKSDETRWMRFTLDTVGKADWPSDRQGRPIYPEGFEELATKLERPLHPPGRDVRCIVSVGMLTEGWDCNTVTHIVGLRPFMSQLLCEQVVGRGLRRASYEVDDDGKLTRGGGQGLRRPVRGHPVQGEPARPGAAARRTEARPRDRRRRRRSRSVSRASSGYTQAIRNRVAVDWASVPKLIIDPVHIPPEVEVKGLSVNNQGRLSLTGPGRADQVTLAEFRSKRRLQELTFDLARSLTRDYLSQAGATSRPTSCSRSCWRSASDTSREFVTVYKPADRKDLFCSPYYGWLVERLVEAIRPDTSQGEAPEVPQYEASRGPGSTADVDFWTTKEVREVNRSHLNYVVADTRRWEEQAAYYIDTQRPGRRVRQEPGPRLRDPLPSQRPASRLRARLHRSAEDRPAEAPDPGDEGLRPAGGSEAGRGRALGRGGQRGRDLRPMGVRRCQEDDGGEQDHKGGMREGGSR